MHTKRQKGFTIIEIVIVIFLFSILLLGLFTIFEWQQRIYSLEMAEMQATSGARAALNEFSESIAQAKNIITSRTVSGTTYSTSGNNLVLELPAVNASGQIIGGGNDYIIFYTNGTSLYKLIDPVNESVRVGGTKLLTDKLQNLSLTYNNGGYIQANQIDIAIITRAFYRGNQSVTVNLDQKAFLRNK